MEHPYDREADFEIWFYFEKGKIYYGFYIGENNVLDLHFENGI
jgi:hypothetical protein